MRVLQQTPAKPELPPPEASTGAPVEPPVKRRAPEVRDGAFWYGAVLRLKLIRPRSSYDTEHRHNVASCVDARVEGI